MQRVAEPTYGVAVSDWVASNTEDRVSDDVWKRPLGQQATAARQAR